MEIPFRHKVSLLIACALCVSLLAIGCATTTLSIDFTQSELKLIPGSSLHKIISSHATNETVVVRVEGRDESVEVKEFNGKEYATVYAVDGKEMEIEFSDITELMILRNTKEHEKSNSHKGVNASTAASAVVEAVTYAPLIPVAIGTWPLLRAMGLDASKNSEDNAKAGLIYRGMSKEDLLQSVGEPREKYACILDLHLKDKPDVPVEIWVYDNDKVLRGGRTLLIDLGKAAVDDNSFDTTFFKDSNSFKCLQLAGEATGSHLINPAIK